jgi:hypothetical protein
MPSSPTVVDAATPGKISKNKQNIKFQLYSAECEAISAYHIT